GARRRQEWGGRSWVRGAFLRLRGRGRKFWRKPIVSFANFRFLRLELLAVDPECGGGVRRRQLRFELAIRTNQIGGQPELEAEIDRTVPGIDAGPEVRLDPRGQLVMKLPVVTERGLPQRPIGIIERRPV